MTSRRNVTKAVGRAAFAAELKDDPRAKAWTGAGWTIGQAEGDFPALVESGLDALPGIDKDLADLARCIMAGEASPLLVELESDLPEGLFAVGQVKGLGPKKVKALWRELGVTSLGELEYAIQENRLLTLKGFGQKTQEKVASQLEALRKNEGKIRRDEAAQTVANVLSMADDKGQRVAVAGDYRRGEELCTELVFVLAAGEGDAAFAEEIARLRGVRCVRAEAGAFGVALVEETGCDAHLDALRAKGTLAGDTEDEVYAGLGLLTTPAERRLADVPLVLAGTASPSLVQLGDLQGALHNHTVASDGTATLHEMRRAAAAFGLAYLGISEHSQAAAYARGLSPAALSAQAKTIAGMNREGHACTLLSGVESDILADGALDYSDEQLRELDIVVASVHQRFKQDPAAMTARMVRAALHPLTAIIGHPTGRLLLAREESGVEIGALIEACAEGGTALELNANPHRLDLSATHAAMAKEHGVLVSIGADAHSTEGLRNLEHGVAIARRAGLGPEDVLNTRSLDELRAWRASSSSSV